jgi:hypothetical protein
MISKQGFRSVFSNLRTASSKSCDQMKPNQVANMCSTSNGHDKDMKRGWALLWSSLNNKVFPFPFLCTFSFTNRSMTMSGSGLYRGGAGKVRSEGAAAAGHPYSVCSGRDRHEEHQVL